MIKEDVPFFMTFVAVWLFCFKKERRKLAFLLFIASSGYFLLIQKWQATFLDHTTETYIDRYRYLGNSKLEVLKNLILNPPLWLEKLLLSKGRRNTIIIVFFSFLFLPLFAPKEILLFILPLLQNMLAEKVSAMFYLKKHYHFKKKFQKNKAFVALC